MHLQVDATAAIVGDIAPGDGVSKKEKNRRETEAMEQIRGVLGHNTVPGMQPLVHTSGQLCRTFQQLAGCDKKQLHFNSASCLWFSGAGTSIRSLWQEYEDAETTEAKLVKDFDKVRILKHMHILLWA